MPENVHFQAKIEPVKVAKTIAVYATAGAVASLAVVVARKALGV